MPPARYARALSRHCSLARGGGRRATPPGRRPPTPAGPAAAARHRRRARVARLIRPNFDKFPHFPWLPVVGGGRCNGRCVGNANVSSWLQARSIFGVFGERFKFRVDVFLAINGFAILVLIALLTIQATTTADERDDGRKQRNNQRDGASASLRSRERAI